jgi:hypothetical protein
MPKGSIYTTVYSMLEDSSYTIYRYMPNVTISDIHLHISPVVHCIPVLLVK